MMNDEEMTRFKRSCDGCHELDDQISRVRKTERILVAERLAHKDTKEKCMDLGRRLSGRTEEWEKAVQLGTLVTEKLQVERKKLREIKAIADALIEEPTVEQVGRQLMRVIDGEPFAGQVATEPTGSWLPVEVGGVDLAAEPGLTVEQNWIALSCPAGCEHTVLVPGGAGPKDVAKAMRSQAGLSASADSDGVVRWVPHNPMPNGSIEFKQVRTLEDYVGSITDPLSQAYSELEVAILGVDEEKAWGLADNHERDQWVSGVEFTLAAILKWAQGVERVRAEAQDALALGFVGGTEKEAVGAAVAIITGLGEKTNQGD